MLEFGVAEDLFYSNHGLTHSEILGLDQAIAAIREAGTLLVLKPYRLARSVPNATAIAGQFTFKSK